MDYQIEVKWHDTFPHWWFKVWRKDEQGNFSRCGDYKDEYGGWGCRVTRRGAEHKARRLIAQDKKKSQRMFRIDISDPKVLVPPRPRKPKELEPELEETTPARPLVFGRSNIQRPRMWVNLTSGYQERPLPASDSREPNVVVSKLPNGKHAFCVDIDMNCELVQSKTPGHFHLYIDHECAEKEFFAALDALAECGIVEHNYARASRATGMAVLRLPPVEDEYEKLKSYIKQTGQLFPSEVSDAPSP